MTRPFGTMYDVLLFLHLATVVAAFAPLFTSPFLAAQAKTGDPGSPQRVTGYLASNARRIHLPALILSGLFGLGMVFSSKPPSSDDNTWGFDQIWVSLSFVLWIALCGVVSGMIMPAQRKLAAGDDSVEGRISAGQAVASALFVVMLYLMIWKPGA